MLFRQQASTAATQAQTFAIAIFLNFVSSVSQKLLLYLKAPKPPFSRTIRNALVQPAFYRQVIKAVFLCC